MKTETEEQIIGRPMQMSICWFGGYVNALLNEGRGAFAQELVDGTVNEPISAMELARMFRDGELAGY